MIPFGYWIFIKIFTSVCIHTGPLGKSKPSCHGTNIPQKAKCFPNDQVIWGFTCTDVHVMCLPVAVPVQHWRYKSVAWPSSTKKK